MEQQLFTVDHDRSLPWTVASLDFNSIDVCNVQQREDVFILLCSSSFIESGSGVYAHNLIEHFRGDTTLQTWLGEQWEQEELQHGRALAAYIQHVWPEFNWTAAYQAFWDEYSKECVMEQLEQSRGLELAARCVVETGTASLYRALNAMSLEPVLSQLTANIMSDEVRHYKHFYHHFKRYRDLEKLSRLRIMGALLRRVNEIRNEDGDIALRHVFNERYPQLRNNDVKYRKITNAAYSLLRHHASVEMTVKMLLRPLNLPPQVQGTFEKSLALVSKKLFLH